MAEYTNRWVRGSATPRVARNVKFPPPQQIDKHYAIRHSAFSSSKGKEKCRRGFSMTRTMDCLADVGRCTGGHSSAFSCGFVPSFFFTAAPKHWGTSSPSGRSSRAWSPLTCGMRDSRANLPDASSVSSSENFENTRTAAQYNAPLFY